MKTEIVTSLEYIQAFQGRWNELARKDARDGFFRTFEWYSAWIRHIRTDAEPFVIVVRDEAGEVAGIAPLCRLSYRDHGFRLNSVSSAGREAVSADFLDYLSMPDRREEVLNAIMDSLWDARSEWDIFIAGELYDGGDLDRAIEGFAAKHDLPLRRQEERVCPYIVLPPTFEEYVRDLSPKMRYEVRRDTRELIDKRGATVRVYTEPAELSANIDTLIQLHLAHWQRVGEPGTMSRPGFRDFLREVALAPPTGSVIRLYVLEFEEKPAAALLAFWFGENALFYQTGWDPDSPVARMSPGMVLVAQSIRESIEGGFKYFDFLRGDEAYKCRLTKTSRKTITLLVARSFLAKEYLRAARLKDSVKRLVSGSGVAEPVS
jgi:CelD/BcsL family acetyltransferase involved in cellulose biosynthesis